MAAQPEPLLACIVVTYNGAPWLPQCLNSIQQSTVSARIIVVDNASQDETVAIVRAEESRSWVEGPHRLPSHSFFTTDVVESEIAPVTAPTATPAATTDKPT